MGSLKSAILGTSGTPSKVVDTTSSQYQGLRTPLANGISSILQNPSQLAYQGPLTAGMTGAEQQGLGATQQAAGQVGSFNPYGQAALQSQAMGQMNPFAGLTGLQQYGLGNIASQAFGYSPGQMQTQHMLGGQIAGQMNPFATLSNPAAAGLQQIGHTAFGTPNPLLGTVQHQLGQIATGSNPLTAQLIHQAQAPILQNFDQQALHDRGLFAGAGQQVNASSPFAHASALLTNDTQQQLNNAALGVTSQAFQNQMQGLQQAGQLALQAPAQQLQMQLQGEQALQQPQNALAAAYQQMQGNQLQAAELQGQLSNDAFSRALQGFQAAGTGQQQQSQAYENAANRQLQAGSTLNSQGLQGQQAQLNAQLQNLQAQALPRLIQQHGIDQGIQLYNQLQQQMLNYYNLGGQLSVGQQVMLPGVQGTPGALQSAAQGFGAGLAHMV